MHMMATTWRNGLHFHGICFVASCVKCIPNSFFRLTPETQKIMRDTGIEKFSDLVAVCNDSDFVSSLKDDIKKAEYVKFKQAVTKTTSLNSFLCKIYLSYAF